MLDIAFCTFISYFFVLWFDCEVQPNMACEFFNEIMGFLEGLWKVGTMFYNEIICIQKAVFESFAAFSLLLYLFLCLEYWYPSSKAVQ